MPSRVSPPSSVPEDRRCLHLHIDQPTPERELAILRARAPEVPGELARLVVGAAARVRAIELRKAPSIAETLDWARALVVMGAESLDERVVSQTLDLLLKHEADVEKVKGRLREVISGSTHGAGGTT